MLVRFVGSFAYDVCFAGRVYFVLRVCFVGVVLYLWKGAGWGSDCLSVVLVVGLCLVTMVCWFANQSKDCGWVTNKDVAGKESKNYELRGPDCTNYPGR